MAFTIPYPPILTDANWQKEKGIVAKVVKKETGVGDLMKKLKTEFDAVDWDKFDPYTALPATKDRTPENIEKAFQVAKTEAPKLENIRKAAFALRDRAKVLSAEWAKSKLIPSSSRKHLDAVAAACENFALSCKSPDAGLFKKMKDENAANEAKGRQMLATWITSIKAGFAAVSKTPTYQTYNDKMYQKVRGLGTAVGNIPQYKAKWSPVFGNAGFAKGDYIGKDDSADVIKNKLKPIMTNLAKFEAEM
jgi:hypothetical protein